MALRGHLEASRTFYTLLFGIWTGPLQTSGTSESAAISRQIVISIHIMYTSVQNVYCAHTACSCARCLGVVGAIQQFCISATLRGGYVCTCLFVHSCQTNSTTCIRTEEPLENEKKIIPILPRGVLKQLVILQQASKPQTPTPNPKPQTPNPKPQTPNPKPQTPNPKPQTLNPKP